MLAFALNGRALALAELGRMDESTRDYEESIRLCPTNAWAYYNRGIVLYKRGHRGSTKCSNSPCSQSLLLFPNVRETAQRRFSKSRDNGSCRWPWRHLVGGRRQSLHCVYRGPQTGLPSGELIVDGLAAGRIGLLDPNMKPGHVVENKRRIEHDLDAAQSTTEPKSG